MRRRRSNVLLLRDIGALGPRMIALGIHHSELWIATQLLVEALPIPILEPLPFDGGEGVVLLLLQLHGGRRRSKLRPELGLHGRRRRNKLLPELGLHGRELLPGLGLHGVKLLPELGLHGLHVNSHPADHVSQMSTFLLELLSHL